ncbi:NAD(P)/FAD-dependent oxidoreductase [Pedobacter frigiditerrae]|uniref:NAD(P)/FAD-dependent oxidoreductase n=1 Tax=Pedobacter frigiditerrae TaxID=2530452 RepID=A0A4R0N220_9SPHI|nr:NAD(P)/FAD-dependent oxidoreductase [Pedobacter frigiditerrae]TCC93869.1 NAD(P)/FAD-dependent oxidoreductase [Pedobacter frigiditerrae]
MQKEEIFDVIIVGGSYAGLAAGMALGRSLRKVLIIDSGKPCNWQTPHSHNFLTRDGETPANLAAIAKAQVLAYPTVRFLEGIADNAVKTETGFEIKTSNQQVFVAKKLVITTGVKDIFPAIKGFAECWGISVLHCPYCHGYEVRGEKTGVIANGEIGFEFSKLISNWTKDLTLFTNGIADIDSVSQAKLLARNINIVQKEIKEIVHEKGSVQRLKFRDESTFVLEAIYARVGMEHNTKIITDLNIQLNEQCYVDVNSFRQTNVYGVYAAGDCTTMMRSVSDSVAGGNMVGAMLNKELVNEQF